MVITDIPKGEGAAGASLEDEAFAWVLRLTSGEAGPEDRRAFIVWRDQSPAHAQAIADARELWTELGPALVAGQERRAAEDFAQSRAANDDDVEQRWAAELGPAALRPSRRRGAFGAGLGRAAAVLVAVAALGLLLLQQPFADISTAGGQRAARTLPDGSRVLLAPDSALDVAIGPSGERRVTLAKGEAMFDVAHDPSRPFIVQSGEGQVRVLGTAFSVRRTGGGITRVTVVRGKVQVTSGQARRVLTPDRTVAYGLTTMGGIQAVDARAALGWTRDRLIFENQSLGDVIAELDRFEPQKIILLNRRASDKRVNAVVDLKRTDQWLQALEQSEHVGVTRLPGVILIR